MILGCQVQFPDHKSIQVKSFVARQVSDQISFSSTKPESNNKHIVSTTFLFAWFSYPWSCLCCLSSNMSSYMCLLWITAFHLQSQIPNGSHVESAIALLLYRYNVEQSLIFCDIAGCSVLVKVACFGPQKDFFLLKDFCFPQQRLQVDAGEARQNTLFEYQKKDKSNQIWEKCE